MRMSFDLVIPLLEIYPKGVFQTKQKYVRLFTVTYSVILQNTDFLNAQALQIDWIKLLPLTQWNAKPQRRER